MEGAGEGRTGDWGEVVTRYPYENVGMDHLLSMEKRNRKKNLRNFGDGTLKCEKFQSRSCKKKFLLLGFERLFLSIYCSLKTR